MLCTTHFGPWVHNCALRVYWGRTHTIYTKINDFTAYRNASQRCFIPHCGTSSFECTVYGFRICVYICVSLYTPPYTRGEKIMSTHAHTYIWRGRKQVGIQGNIYIYIVIIVIYMYIGCVPMWVLICVLPCTDAQRPLTANQAHKILESLPTLTIDARAAQHSPHPNKNTLNPEQLHTTQHNRENKHATGSMKKFGLGGRGLTAGRPHGGLPKS